MYYSGEYAAEAVINIIMAPEMDMPGKQTVMRPVSRAFFTFLCRKCFLDEPNGRYGQT